MVAGSNPAGRATTAGRAVKRLRRASTAQDSHEVPGMEGCNLLKNIKKLNEVNFWTICGVGRIDAAYDRFPKMYPLTYPQKMWTSVTGILMGKKVTVQTSAITTART